MALQHIVKFIYNHGNEEVIKRGKKIFLAGGGIQILKSDEFSGTITFRVRNDIYQNYYNVTVAKYEDENAINVRCTCPYNMGEICRHEVAALLHLNDLLLTQQLTNKNISYDQSLTIIRMRSIELKQLKLFNSDANNKEAEFLSLNSPGLITSAADENVAATFTIKDQEYKVQLKRNDDKTFSTSCTCIETQYPLCVHKSAFFLQLLNAYGSNYFDTIRNWDSQKNRLLQLYGYTLNDNLEGKFEFTYIDEKPILRVLDGSIKKLSQMVQPPTPTINIPTNTPKVTELNTNKRLGVVILAETKFPYFGLEVIEGTIDEHTNNFYGKIVKLDIAKYIALDKYAEADKNIVLQCRKLLPAEANKFIAKNSYYGDFWDSITGDDLDDENKKLYLEYLHPKLLKLFEQLGYNQRIYFLPLGEKFTTTNIKSAIVIQASIEPSFYASWSNNKLELTINQKAGDSTLALENNLIKSTLVQAYNNNNSLSIYIAKNASTAVQISKGINIPEFENVQECINTFLLPLSKQYKVEFDSNLIRNQEGVIQSLRLYLSENNDNFIFKPFFVYQNDTEVPWNEEVSLNTYEDDKLVIVNRDKPTENRWIEELKALHTSIKAKDNEGILYIHAQHALKGNWYFNFFDTLKKWKVQILGFEKLNRFKIRKTKPTTSLHVSSGVDWFDTEVEVAFDGVAADIDEIKRSLAQKKNFVALNDGTYGLLPEEWLNKYSLLFKMSENKNGKLRVSKYNFAVIDELYDAIDDESIREELQEKKTRLLNIDPASRELTIIPDTIKATLRPYQHHGFDWLQYLSEVQWGGLLADDMGLGKTLQTLTFLQHYKEKNGELLAIVVCPTTLLFNWENEIKKFTTDITFYLHHGSTRTTKLDVISSANVVLTTYGTLRSDIELFLKLQFDYAILDESQAIKNPVSKVTKAACLLNAKNRIALSGTPMQNNTFDIYAQLNFLNPGMLGTKDFFKDNFATPIDKFQEATTKEHLRKIIYPFLLRRTKEQVAKDLPDKTEITMVCEMEPAQRKIYDYYKNLYRSKLLGTIEDQGIEKSQLAILQGLMKLRQICDSPAILKNEEVTYKNESIKIKELSRELQENTGNHKVLIFSQFLGMLGLIREELKTQGINHEYFDGSYTKKQREDAINNFQDNEECRVFLISLKAGGMGLNLTSADYVYLMDPWWNPAVEQQAIDRTHRIGQTKNIFAYRYICKDTVEEKIAELKQRKNSLVRDIIADDDGFLKQLSKEDVLYLFE